MITHNKALWLRKNIKKFNCISVPLLQSSEFEAITNDFLQRVEPDATLQKTHFVNAQQHRQKAQVRDWQRHLCSEIMMIVSKKDLSSREYTDIVV